MADPRLMDDQEEIPRLFYIRRDDQRVADGVQWPDGTVTVRWRGEHASTVNWSSFDDAEAIHVHQHETTTVVWRRQDTYATPEPS